MTREKILSIEGVKAHEVNNLYEYSFGDLYFNLSNGVVYEIVVRYETAPIKPISDIETLKQFLSFFEV